MKDSNQKKRRMIITYSVMTVIVTALVLYIALRREDRVRYVLPEMSQVDASDISAIKIEGPVVIELLKQGDMWIISPEGFAASQSEIDSMLEALSDFTITDLVSTAEFYDRYELDDERKLHITAKDSGNVVRSFDLGKRAPSYNHTYVRLDSDSKVYHAAADLRRIFDKDKEDLRDKKVLSFDRSTIVKIGVSLLGRNFGIQKSTQQVQASSEEEEIRWESSDGSDWDSEVIDDLLDRLDDLSSTSFVEGEDEQLGEPQLTLELLGQEKYTFTLFQKDDAGYMARSSYTPYAFYISSWQGDSILEPFSSGDEQ